MARAKKPVLTTRGFAIWLKGSVDYYNGARPHRGLKGEIPDVVFDKDPMPLYQLESEFVARALMRRELEVVIQKDGIEFDGVKYHHEAMFPHIGEQAELGWLEQEPGYIEVFLPKPNASPKSSTDPAVAGPSGESVWLCRAKPIETASKGMSGRVYRARQHVIQTVEAVHAAALSISVNEVIESQKGTSEEQSSARRRRRAPSEASASTSKSARAKALKRLEALKQDGTFR
jgi:hypothetical protein